MRIRKRDLARIVRGELTIDEARVRGLLIENEPAPQVQQTDPTQYENASLDAQVDKFILDADPSGQGQTQESLVREADDEASPPSDPNLGKPPVPTKRLDMMSFATDIARLVEKSENLLDIKGTIVRRALNYVSKNYDPKQAKDVAQILENNFGVSAEPGTDPYEDETAPSAVGAGASGLQQA